MSRKIVNLTKLASSGLFVLLAGCASAPPPSTQTVEVPVYVPCVAVRPQRPVYEFDKVPADASDGRKVMALARDWVRGRKYEGALEAAVAGCLQ
jgi:hypothetical protein